MPHADSGTKNTNVMAILYRIVYKILYYRIFIQVKYN